VAVADAAGVASGACVAVAVGAAVAVADGFLNGAGLAAALATVSSTAPAVDAGSGAGGVGMAVSPPDGASVGAVPAVGAAVGAAVPVGSAVGSPVGFAVGAALPVGAGSTVPPLRSVQAARSARFWGSRVTPLSAVAMRSMVTVRWLVRVVSTACWAAAAFWAPTVWARRRFASATWISSTPRFRATARRTAFDTRTPGSASATFGHSTVTATAVPAAEPSPALNCEGLSGCDEQPASTATPNAVSRAGVTPRRRRSGRIDSLPCVSRITCPVACEIREGFSMCSMRR